MSIFCLHNNEIDSIKLGSKAENLSKLIKAGFTVPEALCITYPYSDTDLEMAWSLLKDKTPLAIRSSMRNEDTSEFSNAGKFTTVLGVKDIKSFYKSVGKVFHSGSLNEGDTVICQQMVKSQISGVMFTKSPTNEDRILIEACYGLGELLVSGKITPDRYEVSRNTLRIMDESASNEKAYGIFISEKTLEVGEDAQYIFGKARCVANIGSKFIGSIEYNTRNKASLEVPQIKMLSELGLQIEEFFGQPQDIEWAIDNKGIQILQSRPICNNTFKIDDLPCEFDRYRQIRGSAVSFGTAKGKVVQMERCSKIDEYQKDIILVGFELLPEVAYKFKNVKAIITEVGGMLCHAAIVARELGIPCIVGIKNACEIFKEDDVVYVDGNKGIVIREEEKCFQV